MNKSISRVAGLLNLFIAILAPFSIIYVPSKLVVAGNAAATAHNILSFEINVV